MREHGIATDGKPSEHGLRGNVEQMFDENEDGQFIPRAVFVDTEDMPIEELMKTDLGQLIDLDQLIYGKESAAFFSRGKYTIGKAISDQALNTILKLVSKWINLEAILVFHSLSGGTGSGVFCQLVDLLLVHLPKVKIISITIMPSQDYSSLVIEPYNFIWGFYGLLEYSDISLWYDNQSCFKICENKLKIESPNLQDINELILYI